MKTKSDRTWKARPATRMWTPVSTLCCVLPVAASAPPKAWRIREMIDWGGDQGRRDGEADELDDEVSAAAC